MLQPPATCATAILWPPTFGLARPTGHDYLDARDVCEEGLGRLRVVVAAVAHRPCSPQTNGGSRSATGADGSIHSSTEKAAAKHQQMRVQQMQLQQRQQQQQRQQHSEAAAGATPITASGSNPWPRTVGRPDCEPAHIIHAP